MGLENELPLLPTETSDQCCLIATVVGEAAIYSTEMNCCMVRGWHSGPHARAPATCKISCRVVELLEPNNGAPAVCISNGWFMQ